ncbi:F0F1 ATP synthase subunit A [Oleiharenicola sp. Vm1]|uniref:F0F1 ATP synthase subunit A n=1 Tax=Oleiharenicola sp. Vm1 TaxID=3398393 RepID=UPI0039F48099
MRIVSKFLALLLALGATTAAFAEGVDPKASVLFDLGGGWRITNSMMTGWVVSLVIIGLILYAVGNPKVLPGKAQSVFESVLEALRDLFEPIVGKKAFPAVFPLLVTLFIFILIQNWAGLLPGVGTVGVGHEVDGEFHLTRAFVRPFTADFNSTIALALISFGAYLIIILKYAGPKLILWDLFGNKADKKETPGWLYPILSLVFLVVGCIEVFSIAIRPFTLSVRLFGNVFGGENLLHGTGFFPVFYFMELLVGLIQATVFTLLSAVYVGLICNHGDDHDHAHEGAHGEAHH